MKILSILLAAAALLSCTPPAETAQELALRFNTPAAAWEETLPLGNGRIGMMPDGGIDKELIVLNDITMWSGSEDPEALNPEALNYLPKIRELLLTGKNGEAQRMMYDHFQCGGLGSSGGKSKDAFFLQLVRYPNLTKGRILCGKRNNSLLYLKFYAILYYRFAAADFLQT